MERDGSEPVREAGSDESSPCPLVRDQRAAQAMLRELAFSASRVLLSVGWPHGKILPSGLNPAQEAA